MNTMLILYSENCIVVGDQDSVGNVTDLIWYVGVI